MPSPLLLALAVAAAGPAWQADLTRYFPDAATELSQRTALMQRIDAYAARPAAVPATPAALLERLRTYDALYKDIERHDTYVYLRAESDTDDRADAAADTALGDAIDTIADAAGRSLAALGAAGADRFVAREPRLAPWRFFIATRLKAAATAESSEAAQTLLARPALASLGDAYAELRRQARAAAAPASDPAPGRAAFLAQWTPYLANEPGFAAVLAPLVTVQEGQARLQGFANAADAAYARRGLSTAQVHAALAAVRGSPAYTHYAATLASAAARRLKLPADALNSWDLDAPEARRPPATAFPDAVALVLAAVKPMGAEYAGQYERLFDPAAGRVEWCHADKCDDGGFSTGFAGVASGLFYGAFDGRTDAIRAVAHEAGHAVHRQFMNEHQPLAAYNAGPAFLFESFAIFNELLLLDHLQRGATTPAARAWYLQQFMDDTMHNVFGSARETDLEEALHAGVRDGTLRNAADFDALTLARLRAYTPAPLVAPEMKAFWAKNRLYFRDPFYDVNYLFAGLLALEYLHRFERDPAGFAPRYLALLKNGFDAEPKALLQRFVGIDLDDADGLAADASALMDARGAALARLLDCADADADACTVR